MGGMNESKYVTSEGKSEQTKKYRSAPKLLLYGCIKKQFKGSLIAYLMVSNVSKLRTRQKYIKKKEQYVNSEHADKYFITTSTFAAIP